MKYQKGDILYHSKFDCYWELIEYHNGNVVANLLGFSDHNHAGLLGEYVSLSKYPKEYAIVMNKLNPPLMKDGALLYRNGGKRPKYI